MVDALELSGHLALLAGDDPIEVEFRGDVIEIRFPGIREAWSLRRRLDRPGRRALLRQVQGLLGRADLELQIWVGRRRLGRLAADSRPTRLAAWLGLDPLELDTRAAWNERGRRRTSRAVGDVPDPSGL